MTHRVRTANRTGVVIALITLALSGFFVETLPGFHTHAAQEPGLYNEHCLLALLATRTQGASLTSVISAVTPLTTADASESCDRNFVPNLLASSAEPRAPPTR
jgi:hypothetical protein